MNETGGTRTGLTIYRNTSVSILADHLIEESGTELCGGSLFDQLQVIVPNKSAARYLTLRYARRFGIAAGVEFPFLMSLFQRTHFREPGGPQNGSEPKDPEINPSVIAWRVCKVLPELLPRDKFAFLRNWMNGDNPLRRLHFGQEMGRLYDRYMLYRPEWINEWERQPSGTGDWQAELWRAAGGIWAGRHFPALYEQILSGKLIPREKGRIRIFGFSAIPPRVLECLEAISRYRPVSLYHFIPSREFFGSGKPPKEELKEFVRLYLNREHTGEQLADLREYYFQHHPLVSSFAAQARNLLNGTIDWNEGETEPAPNREDTLLHRLQKKIAEDDKTKDLRPGPPCRSIQFRNCYSPFREAEAAHNFLLHCFEEMPDLTLNDILVMTPSPDKFAPVVDAVFNHSEVCRLPVSIADRKPAEEQPAFHTLLKVLQLHRGHFTLSEVFGILQDRQVQEHLGITPDDCKFCQDRAAAAGIRWGWDAEEHSRSGGVDFKETAWQSGLDRLLLNWALDSDPAVPYRLNGEDTFPVPGFADNSGVLLGKFAVFAKKLHDWTLTMRRRQTEGAPFPFWKQFLIEVAEELFGEDSKLAVPLLQELRKWEKDLTAAGADTLPLNSEIIVQLLAGLTERTPDSSRGFLRGKITFCGLRPMRNIPAKVIVLLGMDHDAFPTTEPKQEFDLLRRRPETGDPNLREDERQLFLDLILCAGEYLYVSYTGRNNHDRKKIPPSVCVEELRSSLIDTFGKNSFIDLEEPLHSFSAELFRQDAPNQSYSNLLRDAAEKTAVRQSGSPRPLFTPGFAGAPDEPEFYRLAADELIRFFRNPADFFLTRRLHARIKLKRAEASDDFEAFTAGYLRSDEKNRLLECCIRSAPEEREKLKAVSIARFKADSVLPYGLRTEWAAWDEITGIAGKIPPERQIRNGRSVDLTLSGGRVIALLIPEIRVDGSGMQYLPWFRKDLTEDGLIEGIIMHLAACLAEPTATRIVLPTATFTAKPLDPKTAEQRMRTILELYLEGLNAPLPFFPKTSLALAAQSEKIESEWMREKDKFAYIFGEELPDRKKAVAIAEQFYSAVTFEEDGKEVAK